MKNVLRQSSMVILVIVMMTPFLWAQSGGRQGGGRGGQQGMQGRGGQYGMQGRGAQQGMQGRGNQYGMQNRGGQQGMQGQYGMQGRGGQGMSQGGGRQSGYGIGCQSGMGNGGPRYGQSQGGPQRSSSFRSSSTQLAPLTDAEQADLIHMREEEKLARDVYLTLGERWNTPIFSNISRAESVHMNALGIQIQRHGLLDPVTDDSVGAFTNPQFTQLFEQLVEAGSVSIEGAYEVGREIEVLDIEDLDKALERTQNETIRRIYHNLRRGSENHLRAFSANL